MIVPYNYLPFEFADTKYIFAGFNALNAAEETIVQSLLADKQAKIYWDIDQYFYDSKIHNSSYL